MASIALLNTASFAQFLQDGIDKPPYRLKGGRFTLMHDDEIVGFAAPPEGSSTDHLVGWTFYPDENLNLSTTKLATSGLKVSTDNVYFGLPATATGRMHTKDNDEIFVVYADPDRNVQLYVLDPATGNSWATAVPGAKLTLGWGYGIGNYIDCATGDVDGDGVDEVVVAYHGGTATGINVFIVVLRWNSDTEKFVSSGTYNTNWQLEYEKNLAVTTADVDGDGNDEIAVAIENYNYDTTILLYNVKVNTPEFMDHLTIPSASGANINALDIAAGDLDGDGNDELTSISSSHQLAVIDVVDSKLILIAKTGVHTTPSLWLDNHIAVADLDMDGNEEAVTASNYGGHVALRVFDFDQDLAFHSKYSQNYDLGIFQAHYNVASVDVALGNFDGKQDIDLEAAVVVRSMEQHGTFPNFYLWPDYRIVIFDVTADLGLKKKKTFSYNIDQTNIFLSDAISPKLVVATGDFDGDSVILGEPDHWVIQDHPDFSAVIAEPPKHIDYIKETEEGSPTELNVSRKGGAPDTTDATFFTKYEYTKETDTETTDKSGTDYDWGVKTEVEIERDFGIPKIGEVKAKIDASAGHDYDKKKEEWNSVYQKTEVGKELKAINDDYLVYRSKNIHVWRYPIIGETEVETEDGKKGQLYMQMTFPSDKVTYNIEGRTVEWYQPVHESGNIFSYPWDKSQIENLGDIKTVNNTFATGGNEATFFIDWTNAGTDGVEVSTEKKVGVDASVSLGGEILKAKTQVKVKGHYDKTWSSLHTSETTNSQSHGISIFKCPFDDSYAYQFSPFIYENSKLGVLQVDYTVDPLATTAKDWWNLNYKQLPDLALNLPSRWHSADGVDWEFNKGGLSFQKMKGLFFLDSDGKPFGYSIEEGKPVTVKARVYNYSFVDVSDVEVKIEGQYDECNATKTDNRFKIDTVTIPSIQGFENASNNPNWKYAEVVFDTTGRAEKYYCFWVTVDPADKIQEMANHDNGDTYENNKGYFGITLYVTAQSGSTGSIPEGDLFHEVIISNDAPVEGEAVLITANVYAADRDFSHVSVYFYDDDPDEGGKLFDIELIPYIVAGGSYTVSVPYKTYGKVGTHEIYVVIDKKIGEHTYTNNTDVRIITVQEKSWKDEVIDRLR